MNPFRPILDLWSQWIVPPAELVAYDDPEESFEPFAGPLEALPRNRTEVYRVFGNPGVGKIDKKFAKTNLLTATELPGKWNKGDGRLYLHRLAEPYLREALRRCRVRGCLDEIKKLGCYNFRHQRHDPARPLSYHSWGISVDINSADNCGIQFSAKKPAPKPFSDEWKKIWPNGVSETLVQCFESVGWSWGGRWSGYIDGMHWELVR